MRARHVPFLYRRRSTGSTTRGFFTRRDSATIGSKPAFIVQFQLYRIEWARVFWPGRCGHRSEKRQFRNDAPRVPKFKNDHREGFRARHEGHCSVPSTFARNHRYLQGGIGDACVNRISWICALRRTTSYQPTKSVDHDTRHRASPDTL